MSNQIVLTTWRRAFLWAIEGDDGLRALVGEAIAQLNVKDLPVIVFTECGRAELAPIRQQFNWTDPFVTESGSGIFTLANHNPFEPVLGELEGDYYVQERGCPYVQARAALRVLANVISHPLKGFGDFTVPKLERFLEISEAEAHRAKDREFSEPFMTPKAVEADVLTKAAQEIGFDIVLRDPEESRFSELIGAGVGLSAAATEIVKAYQTQLSSDEILKVTGISRYAEDLGLLAEASGSAAWKGLTVAPTDEPVTGWLQAIKPLLA